MRMSDLMACDVYAADGRCLGRVRDVRLVMDGPVRGSLAALRVDALIVGGSAFAGRLGYLRGGVRGPILLSALMHRLEARAITIEAADITHWDVDDRRLITAAHAIQRGDPDR